MSQMYRLFGLEFTPARLDLKLPIFDKTGFEVGCIIGFDRVGRSVREMNIFEVLGYDMSSETVLDFEDEIRLGDSDLIGFIRDVIAGYEHAKVHMKMAADACSKLSHCMYFFSRRPRYSLEIVFPVEALEKFKGTDFFLKQADDRSAKSSEAFLHTSTLDSGSLLVGKDQVPLAIHPAMVYDQDSCRAIHNYIGALLETLYAAMEELMAIEHQESVINSIRLDIEAKVKSDFIGDTPPEHCPEVPNFYMPNSK